MSPKVKARLGAAGCRKRFCIAKCGHPARHHIRHQAMWVRIWHDRRRNEDRFKRFVRRYYLFHQDDVIVLGANHHAEVHILYDVVIKAHMDATGLPLAEYSWDQAEDLMDRLELAFRFWINVPTPGFSHSMLNRLNGYRHNFERMVRLRKEGHLSRPVATAVRKYEEHREWLKTRFPTVCTVQIDE